MAASDGRPDPGSDDEAPGSAAPRNARSKLPGRGRAEQELVAAREELHASSERLRLALDAGQLGDWHWDLASDRVTLGVRTAQLFGLAPGSIVTRAQLRELLVPGDRAEADEALQRALAERSIYSMEYRVEMPAGGPRWIAVSGQGVYSASGSLLGVAGVMQDITERKRIEASLQEETRMLELLNRTGMAIASKLELVPLLQAVTDAATQLSGAQCGAFFRNVTDESGGLRRYTLSGPLSAAFEGLPSPSATPLFMPTIKGEGTLRIDDVLQDPRYGKAAPHYGMPREHPPLRSYLAVSVISRSGEVMGGLFFGHTQPGRFTERVERLIEGIAAQAAVAIDNARLYEAAQKAAEERKQLLESERAARTEAQRLGDMKDEFLTTLSHELRTPLSAILGWAHALRRHTASEADLHKGLDTIERNARIQTQLIEDLLDVSRITSGKVRLDMRPVEAVSVIEAAVETARPAAEAKGIGIEKLLDPAAGAILADPNRLQQVVWNLLSNAIKFTPSGGRVQVLLNRSHSDIAISVTDTGAGIRPEFIAHVFERFRQGDASITRTYGGLGLGLSIVKSLVELHGGTVAATSPGEGRGATFCVRLPAIKARRRSSDDDMLDLATAGLPSLDYQNADLSAITVLVVDDQADARELLERVLSECGARVIAAGSAGEALDLIAEHDPDVLVADIGMPEVDGFELLRRVRTLGSGRAARMPAIALTAFARSEDRTRALRAGFQVHVAKPVAPPELVATVASVLGRAPGDRT